jgi:hypothetical protein
MTVTVTGTTETGEHMDPTGFILATNVAHRDTHSARPDAPVVPDKKSRLRRSQLRSRSRSRSSSWSPAASVRRTAAASLRGLAAWIEPRHRDHVATDPDL